MTDAWANSDTYLWGGGSVLNPNDWEDGDNWINLDNSNSTGQVPAADADVLIDGNVTVYISSDVTTGSIQLSAGADLIITSTGKLTTQEGGLDGSHGIRLDLLVGSTASGNYSGTTFSAVSASSTLTVNGTLNINVAPATNQRAPKAGLFINASNSVTVGSSGTVNIIVAGTNGMEITGNLTNNGNISITNPTKYGIQFESYGELTNGVSGTLMVSGGTKCMNFRSNSSMTNNGTVQLTGASTDTIITAGSPWDFYNNKIFQGDGVIDRAKFFVHGPMSTLIPGSSPGCLNFFNGSDAVSLSGVTLQIEINGTTVCSDYDQIEFSGSGNVDLTGATLNPIFTYAPLPGDMFSIITANSFSGSFASPMAGQMVTVGNTSFIPSYSTSGSGTSFDFSVSDFLFPVELTAFTARPAGKAVQLQWATATETNNDYFSVEHSTDGRSFREIGRVAGAGTSQEERRYAFADHAPAAGLNYYRLRQHDFDGRYEYSDIRSVVFGGESPWTIYPTLAHESVTVEWVSAPGGDSIIEAFNLAGKKVYARKAPGQSASLQIPVQDWLPGQYWVLVRSNGGMAARQFVKE
ncbi:MAG: hypothetical protein H6559_17220 [Lewinellaceae bacterium]|nr:hypothetical protein [Lewinellaceae bacterium]